MISTITLYQIEDYSLYFFVYLSNNYFTLSFLTSNGNTFKNGVGSTVLNAKVYSWDEDITSTISASKFNWIRKSSNTSADAIWNSTKGIGKKQITVTTDDLIGSAVFSFEVNLPE